MESPILSSAQMREAEEAAFARGVAVEALMEQAGAGVARAVREFFPLQGKCLVFAGKGHNGGDALVAGQYLKRAGWEVEPRLVFAESDCSELTRRNLQLLRDTPSPSPVIFQEKNRAHTIILDGLLGLGAKEMLREPIRSAAKEINRLRREQNMFVFAVDLPTGLNSETGVTDPEDCVVADCTVAIGFAKHGLLVDYALDFVGRIEVVPLSDLTAGDFTTNEYLATAHSLRTILPRRKFGSFKNQLGRIGVVAGSEGLIGAAVMTAEGALRGGAGLVEVFVPKEIYPLVVSAAPVEAMVKPIRSYRDLLKNEEVDVWAVGPGLGKQHASEILKLVANAEKPMVLDADGLNIVSEKRDLLQSCAGPRLLTPHPGEMKRLFDTGKMSPAGIARHFCDQFPVTLLLKGSHSVVAERNKPLSYNSTGNPGMATGGMGDVLTGVCAALWGRGLPPYDVARIGAWVCGRAAERSIFFDEGSEESLLPRDVLSHLGGAFNDLRNPLV